MSKLRSRHDGDYSSKVFRLISDLVGLPAPPEISWTPKQMSNGHNGWGRFSAVYFVKDFQGDWAYVGQTKNLSKRMKKHESIIPSDSISFIPTEECSLGFVECFYIWALKPYRNKEGCMFYKDKSIETDLVQHPDNCNTWVKKANPLSRRGFYELYQSNDSDINSNTNIS